MLSMSYMAPSPFCTVGTMVGGAVSAGPSVPVNTIAPALNDTSVGVGDTVTCGTGTWTNTPTSYAYQWKRDGSNIGGATSNSYLVDAADEGAVLTCAVTASNAGGAGSPALSNATDPIPGEFAPTDIAGCKLWLDASQIVGLSDGDPVATWTNLGTGGSGNDAVQGTSGNRGTYQTNEFNSSLPVVRLDGSDDFYLVGDFSSLTAATVFIVQKRGGGDGDSGKAGLWDFSASDDPKTYYTFGGNIYDTFGTTVRKDGIAPGTSIVVPHLYSVVSQSGEWTARINGAQIHTTATNAVTFQNACYIGRRGGGGDPYDGDIAEVIIYDSALGTTDRQAVEAYLTAKYGL